MIIKASKFSKILNLKNKIYLKTFFKKTCLSQKTPYLCELVFKGKNLSKNFISSTCISLSIKKPINKNQK